MRKILKDPFALFLIVSLSLVVPLVVALIVTRGFTTPPYQVPVIKRIDVYEGTVRKVTAYNVGDPRQTHSKPCIGAGGDNLCNLVDKGVKVCAANFVPLKSKLYVEKVGECIVLDRMNPRFGNRVDLAMGKHRHEQAVKFGVQRLNVIKDWGLNSYINSGHEILLTLSRKNQERRIYRTSGRQILPATES